MHKIDIDIVILSYCTTETIYNMNTDCIESLNVSEEDFTFNIIIIESNKNFYDTFKKYQYSNVSVIIPEEKFNYNRFMNIGIQMSKNEFVGMCNNDLIFEKHWFTAIYNVSKIKPDILSFGVVNPGFNDPPLKVEKKYLLGYEMRKNIVGNCIIVKRRIFEIIGMLDEQFDYYFQDEDFGMTIRKYHIKNAWVLDSKVLHLGAMSSKINTDFAYFNRLSIDSPKYHKKWGSQRTIAWKNRIVSALQFFKLNHRRLQKFIYGNFNY